MLPNVKRLFHEILKYFGRCCRRFVSCDQYHVVHFENKQFNVVFSWYFGWVLDTVIQEFNYMYVRLTKTRMPRVFLDRCMSGRWTNSKPGNSGLCEAVVCVLDNVTISQFLYQSSLMMCALCFSKVDTLWYEITIPNFLSNELKQNLSCLVVFNRLSSIIVESVSPGGLGGLNCPMRNKLRRDVTLLSAT